MDQKQITKSLADHLMLFIEKVHDVKGVDSKLLEIILFEFKELDNILKKEDSIPKEIAMILIDMLSVLHNDALYYKNDEQKSEIYLAADQLSQVAYELCS